MAIEIANFGALEMITGRRERGDGRRRNAVPLCERGDFRAIGKPSARLLLNDFVVMIRRGVGINGRSAVAKKRSVSKAADEEQKHSRGHGNQSAARNRTNGMRLCFGGDMLLNAAIERGRRNVLGQNCLAEKIVQTRVHLKLQRARGTRRHMLGDRGAARGIELAGKVER